MTNPDPLLASIHEDKPPPNPAVSALKRAIWIILTLLIIFSLLASMLLPILLNRRENRRNPENEIQAHWISNKCLVYSVQSSESIQYQLPNL